MIKYIIDVIKFNYNDIVNVMIMRIYYLQFRANFYKFQFFIFVCLFD